MRHGKEPRLTGRLVFPGDPQYTAARQEFNTSFQRFPLVIVYARETEDVVNAVRWARHHRVPIRMRSGGHNYEGLSVVDDGIVIDVSDLRQVEVDRAGGTATVGTGLRNFQLYDALGSRGLVVPSGVCLTPGIAGVTLGGGHSALSRAWGLTADNLLELEMVDAEGRVLRASADRLSDLFWASRGGGGGNFGICTAFRFRARHLETVGFAQINWSLQDLEPVLRVWQEYTLPTADDRMTPLLQMINGDEQRLMMQGVFLGPLRDLRDLLRPLLKAGKPKQVIIEEIPWLDAVARLGNVQPTTPSSFKSVGPFLYDLLPDSGVETVRRFMSEPPVSAVSVFLHAAHGAVADVPNRATAYFWRRALSNISLFAIWDTPDEASAGIRWVEEFREAMLPYTQGVYVNTPDLSIRDWPKQYYGRNFERLTQVKRCYDPDDLFNFPQSIPPA